jgi:hypothetical protein
VKERGAKRERVGSMSKAGAIYSRRLTSSSWYSLPLIIVTAGLSVSELVSGVSANPLCPCFTRLGSNAEST